MSCTLEVSVQESLGIARIVAFGDSITRGRKADLIPSLDRAELDLTFDPTKTYPARLKSNSSGFRTKEFELKTPTVERIVTLGDSSTFGWGVDPEYTYQQLLARRLTDAGTPTEVFNLGISGHTSRHGIGVFEHYARDLTPDALIISFPGRSHVVIATFEPLRGKETVEVLGWQKRVLAVCG